MRGRDQLRRLPNNVTPAIAIRKLSLIKVLVTPTHSSAATPKNLFLMMPPEAPFVAASMAPAENGGLTFREPAARVSGREICS
jgi:hypothetical protein